MAAEEGILHTDQEDRHGVSPLVSVPSRATGADINRTRTADSVSTIRRRHHEPSPLIRGLTRVGSILHSAHAQDFERKRRPPSVEKEADDDRSSDEENLDQGEAEAEAAEAEAQVEAVKRMVDREEEEEEEAQKELERSTTPFGPDIFVHGPDNGVGEGSSSTEEEGTVRRRAEG